MNGKQPINRGRIRVSSLRLFIVSQHRVLSGVLERSVLSGFLSKFNPPQISLVILSRRVSKACWWPLFVLDACSSSLLANTGDVCSISLSVTVGIGRKSRGGTVASPHSSNMAIIYQESSFGLGLDPNESVSYGIPRSPAAKCFGYAQALESTWRNIGSSQETFLSRGLILPMLRLHRLVQREFPSNQRD